MSQIIHKALSRRACVLVGYSSRNYKIGSILNRIHREFDKEIESFINKVQDKVKEQEVKLALYVARLRGYKHYLFRAALQTPAKNVRPLTAVFYLLIKPRRESIFPLCTPIANARLQLAAIIF
ncbi:MAG: hypothetical protein E7234_14245 [Lachnospiraceae bacterium]|nr:hypothetical protein [Lachnospiraceae bacterium]